jgi:hypothetical protein
MVHECRVVDRITAFSMTMPHSPMVMLPPSAITEAPCMMRQFGPTVTSPQTVAEGATHARGST